MPKTEKIRKSPSESATKFGIGNIKKGNDGNMWKIIATSSGVHRWQKITNTRKIRPQIGFAIICKLYGLRGYVVI